MPRRLSTRAINALLNSCHADLGGKSPSDRRSNLLAIAIACSVNDLLAEPGVGERTVREIQLWLIEKGLLLRSPE